MRYQFSAAIQRNVERTYTFSYVHSVHNYKGSVDDYCPHEFFMNYLKVEPFRAFMALERHGYKNTLRTLERYGIPYTPEQERQARIYYEVTEQMAYERRDAVSRFVEDDLKNTGVVRLGDGHLLTTKSTVDVAKFLKYLPRNRVTDNEIFKNRVSRDLFQTNEQYSALEASLKYHVSCIIGGAGTGKSFVTAEIVKQLRLNKKEVAILAPTHKAREALQGKLDGGTVRTIHSYVHRPSSAQVIVIDEAGMLSTPLFNQLCRVYKGQQLIFIGDKNQLPPVQYGRPFELIQEQFHTTELKANHRSEARDIISLGKQVLGDTLQNANMPITNIEVVQGSEQAFRAGAEVVLTFTNANVKDINEAQRLKSGAESIYPPFRIGEKLIAKTNYKGVYNGQLFEMIGRNTVRDVDTGRIVRFDNPREFEYNFDYAYALTIHKSQGSEWDNVAYMPSVHDTANLAYVAITRARKKLIIVNGLNEEYPKDRNWRQLHEDYRV